MPAVTAATVLEAQLGAVVLQVAKREPLQSLHARIVLLHDLSVADQMGG